MPSGGSASILTGAGTESLSCFLVLGHTQALRLDRLRVDAVRAVEVRDGAALAELGHPKALRAVAANGPAIIIGRRGGGCALGFGFGLVLRLGLGLGLFGGVEMAWVRTQRGV